jgi:hypothetical protein
MLSNLRTAKKCKNHKHTITKKKFLKTCHKNNLYD